MDSTELDRIPADRLYAAEQDMWVRLEDDGTATLGTTHLMAMHGHFMLFTPRPVGTQVAFDRSLGVMETAKSAVAIHAPLSCRVLAANPAVERDVALITRDPYGEGWLFRVQPTQLDADRDRLIDAAAYRAWLSTRMDRFEPPAATPDSVFDPSRWT
ncbi:MAG: glycine cleavage system protein H [Burkholderiaceae bacterium]|nr:glycine cleavage system protein H [Burkholderiaceae bacterium]